MFPGYSSSVSLPIVGSERVAMKLPSVLAAELASVEARRIRVTDNSVRFTGGLFRLVSGLNILGPITRGEIAITSNPEVVRLKYRISFMQLILTASLLVTFFALWIAGRRPFTVDHVLFVCFVWLWLVALNAVVAIFRFRRFLRNCIVKACAAPSGEVK
jgi:hypothetical protein